MPLWPSAASGSLYEAQTSRGGAQAVLAPKGNLADLLALFFRDDLQGWAGRRNPAARSWLREPQLRALVDDNLARCLRRLRHAAPDPPPPARPRPVAPLRNCRMRCPAAARPR